MKERVLPDKFPILLGFWYVVDGEPKRAPISGQVCDLKKAYNAKEVRNCDVVTRNLPIVYV